MKTIYAKFLDNCRVKTVLEMWKDQSYFGIEELIPEVVLIARGQKAIELFQPRAIITLLETRILADAPITINTWKWGGKFSYRGLRPVTFYNELSFSQHILFNAFDYDVKDCTAEEFRNKLTKWKQEGKLKYLTGIEEKVPWVHNDYRLTDRLDDNGLFLF